LPVHPAGTCWNADDPAAIHFFFANFTGMRRKLFPGTGPGLQRLGGNGLSGALADAAEAGPFTLVRRLRRISSRCTPALATGAATEIEAWLESLRPSH
jgi:hypothetical protein